MIWTSEKKVKRHSGQDVYSPIIWSRNSLLQKSCHHLNWLLSNDIQPLTKGFLLDRGSKDQRALSPPEVQEVSNQVMLMLVI